MRPVIGIIACNREVGADSAQAVMTRYAAAAMRHAEADALIVPALPELLDARNVVARLDAVLLTGSPSNLDARHYGGADPGDGPHDPGRDAVALALVDAAVAGRTPLFGICRGFQEINVALGGTLRGDVGKGVQAHHAPDDVPFAAMFDHRHPVALTPGGVLARATGAFALEVRSVHYQGIARLAPGLMVEATAEDGLVEAYAAEPGGAPLVAVQWHPEWQADADPASRAFFDLLGRAARGASLSELAA